MTRQEPQARLLEMQEAAVEVGGYDSPSASAACCLSAHQLQEGQSVFESGPLRSKQACVITPSCEPACLVAVRCEGEKCTKFSAKHAKSPLLGPLPAGNQAFLEQELIATDFGTSRRQGLALYFRQKVTG